MVCLYFRGKKVGELDCSPVLQLTRFEESGELAGSFELRDGVEVFERAGKRIRE